ncbi:MAG: winged helix-turn-helix transcriptional regulator [Nitrososphaeria archaeon]|jgi:DNA-binding transcriptional regulator GbsR (MarR family)
MNEKMQDVQKVITTTKILNLLLGRGSLRWQELKKLADISSRTLSDRLRDLTDKGIVKRKVDPGTRPPSTYYELNPNTDITNFPHGYLFSVFQKFLEKKNQSASLFRLIEKSTSKEILDNKFNSLRHDFLFTLNYIIENPEYSDYLILFYLDQYQEEIKNLISFIREKNKFSVEIEEMFEEFIGEQKKNVEKVIEKASNNFEDKELAKAVLGLYFESVFAYNMEMYIFLVQMAQSPDLKARLEKEFGAPVEEERLNKLISEDAWKDIESFNVDGKKTTNDQQDTSK